jgi:hypothetical protein
MRVVTLYIWRVFSGAKRTVHFSFFLFHDTNSAAWLSSGSGVPQAMPRTAFSSTLKSRCVWTCLLCRPGGHSQDQPSWSTWSSFLFLILFFVLLVSAWRLQKAATGLVQRTREGLAALKRQLKEVAEIVDGVERRLDGSYPFRQPAAAAVPAPTSAVPAPTGEPGVLLGTESSCFS